MIDRLICSDENITRSSFLIKEDNVFVKDNVFQEGGLLENMAQTAALRAGYTAQSENKPIAVGYIGAVNDFEIFDLPKVNDELTTEIAVENQIFDVTIISGKVWCNDNLLAKCEMKLFISNK